MNEFDDTLSNTLGDRADAMPGCGADLSDVRRRVRHHQVVRRSVAAACVTVLALGGVAAVAMRSTDRTPAASDATDEGVAPSGSCGAGQVLSAEGDVVLHEGRPFALASGQCVSVSDLPAGVNTSGGGFCQVIVSVASPVDTTAPSDSTVSTITAISTIADVAPVRTETCSGTGVGAPCGEPVVIGSIASSPHPDEEFVAPGAVTIHAAADVTPLECGMVMCSETGEILSGVAPIATAWSGMSDSVPAPPGGVLVGGCSTVSVDASDAPGFEPAVDTTVTIPAG